MTCRAGARLLGCISLIGLACLPVGTRTAPAALNPELAVRRFIEGYGTTVRGRVVRLFHPDADIRLAGLRAAARGRRGIDQLLQYAQAAEARLSLSELSRSGDTVFCRIAEDNAWLRALGADSLRYSARFVFRGGRIAHAEIRIRPGSRAALGRSAMPFALWAREQEPEAIEQILPGGRPEFSRANAVLLLDLIRRWQRR